MHVQHQANSSFCTLVPLSKVQFTLAFYTQGILYCTYIGTAQIHIFLYQVWLLIRPKFSRKFIQRADVLHTVCFPACLLEICANVWKANAGFFFLVYSTCMIFFFTKFSLAWIFFFCTLPAHHNFSNDSSLTLNSTGKSKQPNCQENQYMHLSSKKNLEIR